MSRFGVYGKSDTPDTGSGDVGWTGINMTLDKDKLQPGVLSLGQNTRLRYGRAKPRRGTDMPGDFNPVGGYSNAFVGSGVFRNPTGNEVLMVAPATEQFTIALQQGKDPIQIDYNGAIATDNGTVALEFGQAFQNLIMLRRPLSPAQMLVWDGDITHDWEIVTLSTNGNTLIPYEWNAEPFMSHMIYYFGNATGVPARDTWIAADASDYTSYDPNWQTFRSNPGESDFITRIMSFVDNSIIIFKNRSIHQATFIPNAFPLQIQQRIINRSLGSFGNKMPLQIGSDAIFLSLNGRGFYKMSQVFQTQINTLPTPISERIQKIIDNINWYATGFWGCSAQLDNYAFFGVSLGTTNVGTGKLNTILVYDTQRDEWESAGDTWADPSFQFNTLHVVNYGETSRLLALDYDSGIIYLLYEGLTDNTKSGTFSVPFKMETRGYTGDNPYAFKRFGRARVSISTYDPSVNITAITDGYNEEKVLTPNPIRKDRTRFYQHGHKTFDIATDDTIEQKREDYSLDSMDNFAGQDFEDLPEGELARIPGTAPLVAGDQQETVEPLLVRMFGRWCALRIENDTGVCEVTGVEIESTPAMNTGRTAA